VVDFAISFTAGWGRTCDFGMNVFNDSGAIQSQTIACVVQLWMLDLLTKHPVLLKRGSVPKARPCEFLSTRRTSN
jgi:hypothetical protein